MKPSEKLMLLLELNGYDITQFKLKKQLEYEKTGNNDLYKHSTYADLVVSHYKFEEKHDYPHRNPLMYNDTWGNDINSIDQFYFTHPDLYTECTFKELHDLKNVSKDHKEKIISDVIEGWTEEYKVSSTVQLNHLKELIQMLPKKSKTYKRPAKLSVFLLILVLLFWAFLYRSPEFLMPSFLGEDNPLVMLVAGMNQNLYDYDYYSLAGFVTIIFTAFYIIFNNALGLFMRDVSSENSKQARRIFKKWGKDLAKARKEQENTLKEYVKSAVKGKTKLNLKSLVAPERKLDRYKWYVSMVNHRYDWMTKHYSTLMYWLRMSLFIAVLMNIGFLVFGLGINGGWINV